MKRANKIKKIIISIGLLTVALFPSVAIAGLCDDIASGTDGWISCGEEEVSFTEFEGGLEAPSAEGYDKGITRVDNVRDYAVNVTNFVLGFLGLLAVIMVIYGGFSYLTAAGEQDQLDKGKKTVTYAIVGIIVVMASFAIVNTVIQAPEGEDRPGVASDQEGGQGEAVISRSQKSFNLLANKVKTMARDLITAYQNHAEVVAEMDSFKEAVKQIGATNSVNDSWGDGLADELNGKGAEFEKLQTRLNTVSGMTKSVLLKKQIQNAEKIWRDIYNNGYASAQSEAESNGCKGSGVCTDDQSNDVLRRMDYTIYQIRALLLGETQTTTGKDPKTYNPVELNGFNYLSESTKAGMKNIELIQFDGNAETPSVECGNEINVGIECMKRYSREGFFMEVNKIKNEIKDIYGQIMNITSIGDEYFALLIDIEQLKGAIQGTVSISSAIGGLQTLKQHVKDNNAVNAEEQIKKMIAAMIQVIEALKNIKFVDAVATADKTEGNAPLIVNFSALDSYDPSNITIGASDDLTNINTLQVQWDLDGNGVYYDESGSNVGKSVTCSNLPDEKGKSDPNTTFKSALTPSCTFWQPGSYRIGLKIKSSNAVNDATGRKFSQEIAEGRTFITIKVNPPSTKIILSAKGESENPVYIRKYNNDGILLVDKNKAAFTLNEANVANNGEGIQFSVAESEQIQDQKKIGYIQRIKWDFGDNSQAEGHSQAAGEKVSELTVSHKYPKGVYRVTAEIMNEKNQMDRIIFDLIIKDMKADIAVFPGEQVKMGTEVTLDAQGSKIDSGKIVDYKWLINDTAVADMDEKEKKEKGINLEDGKSQGTLRIKDVETEVGLTVHGNTPGGPEQDFVSVTITAESAPPVANFNYKIADDNKPSQVFFDGGLSYDPDIAEDSSLVFEWDFGGEEGKDYEFVSETNEESTAEASRPTVQYKKKGTYDVKLTVYDEKEPDKKATITQAIKIDNILSAWWAEDSAISGQLTKVEKEDADTMESTLEFKLHQINAHSVEWDFGDGETEMIEEMTNPLKITHVYKEAGKFKVTATVFDKDDDDLSISRSIFIGSGEKPVAALRVHAQGIEQFNFEKITDASNPITVTRKTVLTFDASDSLNTDGTARKLRYEWKFGDSGNSTQKTVTHTYKDVDLMVSGQVDTDGTAYKLLEGSLTVRDKDDSTKKDDVKFSIKVMSAKPTLKSLTAVIDGSSIETPIDARVEAIDSSDEDGKIIQYRWFYADVNESSEVLGQQITKNPFTKITIGPRGEPGEEKTYRFDVELTDNENTRVKASDILPVKLLPTITVVNGPNEPPNAKFSVDKTSIKVGDMVNFVSTSEDSDGKITAYMWDSDGDGFENDEWTENSTLEKTYKKAYKDGVSVRLKVKDNNSTEAVSKPVMIYVSSEAEPPVAAFTYEQMEGSKMVKFMSNSKADTDNGAILEEFIWDFDTASTLQTSDSDGDGKKDNDKDSDKEDTSFEYSEHGMYKVKLTVIDSEGNEDDVVNIITVKQVETNPTAAFVADRVGDTKTVEFKNNSKQGGANIKKYIWDFDTNIDSDGDGDKTNDNDSDKNDPKHTYDRFGNYKVKLTVTDNNGNTDEVENTVNIQEPGSSQPPIVTPGTTGITPTTPTTTTGTPSEPLEARLKSNPAPSPADNRIHLTGTAGDVTFNVLESKGKIVKYAIDKNIFFDTNGNGVNDDDEDFVTKFPIQWITHFEKSWGNITVKLTIYDAGGNKDEVKKEIVFDAPMGGASVFGSGEAGRLLPAIGILAFLLIIGIAIKVKNHGYTKF